MVKNTILIWDFLKWQDVEVASRLHLYKFFRPEASDQIMLFMIKDKTDFFGKSLGCRRIFIAVQRRPIFFLQIPDVHKSDATSPAVRMRGVSGDSESLIDLR